VDTNYKRDYLAVSVGGGSAGELERRLCLLIQPLEAGDGSWLIIYMVTWQPLT
jgi:hypothetical protein